MVAAAICAGQFVTIAAVLSIDTPGLTVVLGAGGGLGMAFVTALQRQGYPVLGLGRVSQPPLDYLRPDSIALAAAH